MKAFSMRVKTLSVRVNQFVSLGEEFTSLTIFKANTKKITQVLDTYIKSELLDTCFYIEELIDKNNKGIEFCGDSEVIRKMLDSSSYSFIKRVSIHQ